jgi:hypothetical protein
MPPGRPQPPYGISSADSTQPLHALAKRPWVRSRFVPPCDAGGGNNCELPAAHPALRPSQGRPRNAHADLMRRWIRYLTDKPPSGFKERFRKESANRPVMFDTIARRVVDHDADPAWSVQNPEISFEPSIDTASC